MILKKLFAIAIMSLGIGLINSSYAKTPHIVIYQDKNKTSKHIGKLKTPIELQKIIPFYQKGEWIKVGSSQNGKVGWIHKEQIEKFYESEQESRQRQIRYEEPMVSIHESPDGRYQVKEINGTENGVRFRIVEERYAIEEDVSLTEEQISYAQGNQPIDVSDIPQEELEKAMDEIAHMQEISRNIR